jgi:integration host factor subunit beta
MTTTKKDLALRISEKLGVKKQLAYEVVDTLFKAMRESLIQGNRIEIRGFGVLGVKDTKPKPAARNPRTGEIVYVPARKKSYFKAGVLIKKALHKPLEPQEGSPQSSTEAPASGAQPASPGSSPPPPSMGTQSSE